MAKWLTKDELKIINGPEEEIKEDFSYDWEDERYEELKEKEIFNKEDI